MTDIENKYNHRPSEKRTEIFDGVSVWGKSIVEGVKDGTIIFYTRDEGYGSNRGDDLWLWQRYLLFNKKYPNIVYHISS
ncbi:MAG: hypothetical protein LBU10_02330 [Endomicrobium sp.]|nr:hypothetical protein [Endomicrobium sp.]